RWGGSSFPLPRCCVSRHRWRRKWEPRSVRKPAKAISGRWSPRAGSRGSAGPHKLRLTWCWKRNPKLGFLFEGLALRCDVGVAAVDAVGIAPIAIILVLGIAGIGEDAQVRFVIGVAHRRQDVVAVLAGIAAHEHDLLGGQDPRLGKHDGVFNGDVDT